MNWFILTLDAMALILSVALFRYTAITMYAFISLVSDMIATYMSTYRSRMIQSTSLVFATIATIWHVVITFLMWTEYIVSHAEVSLVMMWYVAIATAWRIHYMVR